MTELTNRERNGFIEIEATGLVSGETKAIKGVTTNEPWRSADLG